ncbi:Nn.00g051420.m01.CDS01 [Neocucurbitaria sp. VM-36]
MSLVDVRDVVQSPPANNMSWTIINGVYFNRTALDGFGYTLYSNNTISNASECYLAFDKFKPSMLVNGTWVGATTCYIPYYNIHTRGMLSIAFGSMFGLSLVFTLINLRKHGKLYSSENKRFRIVGKRWQWYWMLFVAACGMISSLTGVDIDRYYLPGLPIILQSFFFMLMVPGALAMVWEETRHWGSWQKRQIHDVDQFSLTPNGRRAKTEFWLPLMFYFFAFVNFFLVIPRSWSAVQKQNTNWQKEDLARPTATSVREKAGAVLAVLAWAVICYSLWHSMKHYTQRSLRNCPGQIMINITLLAIRIGYGIASAWNWDVSVCQIGVQLGWPFGLGYAPLLLIIIVLEIGGFIEGNDDKLLIQQRIARGRAFDEELNITKKPNWWQKTLKDRYVSDEQRLRNMTVEIGGGRATSRRIERNIEMGNMNIRDGSNKTTLKDPFRDEDSYDEAGTDPVTSIPHTQQKRDRDAMKERTDVTQETQAQDAIWANTQAQSQQTIKSMLDV